MDSELARVTCNRAERRDCLHQRGRNADEGRPLGGASGNSGGGSFRSTNSHRIGIFRTDLCHVRYSVLLSHQAFTQLFSSSARALNTVCKTLIPCQLLCLCCKSNSIMSVSFARGAAKCPLRSRLPSRSSF